jgi:hypothetical protein
MGVRPICFQGLLSPTNSITVLIDEQYCLLRLGTWRLRIDSLSVSSRSKDPISINLSLGCNLVKSPQRFQQNTFVVPTPLHVFTVQFTGGESAAELPQRAQLLTPGQTEWHHFTSGTQEVVLQFRDAENVLAYEGMPLTLSVCGILLLDYVE